MKNPDHETMVRAIEDARRVLAEYIQLGARDAPQTVDRLFAVLDRREVVHALVRINKRDVERLVG